MKGDFTRNTFEATRHFSRVLQQQGRVSLDADANEQAAILLHYCRTLAADLIGQAGGPKDALGFLTGYDPTKLSAADGAQLTAQKWLPLQTGDFYIGSGRYYVDGLLCEVEQACTYLHQPDFPAGDADKPGNGFWIVYLDVWERHLSWVEDGRIREVALGGPDTASRAKVVWQVKVLPYPLKAATGKNAKGVAVPAAADLQALLQEPAKAAFKAAGANGSPLLQLLPSTVQLRVRTQKEPQDMDPCSVPPQNRYRGPENQLYRVELHRGLLIADKPTFKWSRENGSVIFPVLQVDADATSTTVRVATLGRDPKLGLAVGDWVELVDDAITLRAEIHPLLQVTGLDDQAMTVTLAGTRDPIDPDAAAAGHTFLRRWDQRDTANQPLDDGAVPVLEGSGEGDSQWIPLEDGIEVQFVAPPAGGLPGIYRPGDYWLIPARVATGDVEWPLAADGTASVKAADGVHHHYAALALLSVSSTSGPASVLDGRQSFPRLVTLP